MSSPLSALPRLPVRLKMAPAAYSLFLGLCTGITAHAAPAQTGTPASVLAAPAGTEAAPLPLLRGLQLHADARSLGDAPPAVSPGINAVGEGLHADPLLARELERLLGRPIDMALMSEISRVIAAFYRSKGRPVVDPQAPPQEITDGFVRVAVNEGRIGKIVAEGHEHFDAEPLLAGIRARPGGVIEAGALLDDIDWLNRNPFRQSRVLFRRGETPGSTDIVVETSDRRPFRPYVGYENSGTATTGYDRLQAGFAWGKILGTDQLLTYQLSASPEFDEFNSHGLFWGIPLAWRNVLELGAQYSRSDLMIDGLGLEGRTSQASARYVVPLRSVGGLRHEAAVGTEYKKSNSNLFFGSAEVFDSDTEIVQFVGSYQARLPDAWGATAASATVVFSPGDLAADNDEDSFSGARESTDPRYLVARVSGQRSVNLPAGAGLILRGSAQATTDRLLASEQLAAGGADSVRGYDASAALGDQGWLGALELRSPSYPAAAWLANRLLGRDQRGTHLSGASTAEEGIEEAASTTWDEGLTLLVFTDWGHVSNRSPAASEFGSETLASAGAGLRYRFGSVLTLRFDYGWQLKDVEDSDTSNSRGHLAMSLSF